MHLLSGHLNADWENPTQYFGWASLALCYNISKHQTFHLNPKFYKFLRFLSNETKKNRDKIIQHFSLLGEIGENKDIDLEQIIDFQMLLQFYFPKRDSIFKFINRMILCHKGKLYTILETSLPLLLKRMWMDLTNFNICAKQLLQSTRKLMNKFMSLFKTTS